MTGARISSISDSSPASRANVAVGDELVSVNGRAPTDIIEYQQLVDAERVELLVRREGDALTRKVVIEKPAGAPLGLSIDSAVFDRIRTCDNHCSFCFIYQLPKGLRRSLYVKDDDYRLSFLYGNFTTLTRFTELDLERVIEERLSPLYVSIHTTDPQLRAEMLRNPRGATSLRWLSELLGAGIDVHGQVVLCPGVNDADALESTLLDVLSTYGSLASLAVVPVGVSDFSLESNMRAHTPEEARASVALVERYAALAREIGVRVSIAASDEFYLVAGLEVPSATQYDSLDDAENGIGMVAAFRQSFRERTPMSTLGTGFFQSVDGAPAWGYRATRGESGARAGASTVLLTGEYAAPLLSELIDEAGYERVSVRAVTNTYFGGNIKVAGLLTGHDLARALSELDEDALVLVPDVCVNEGRFLDGTTLEDLPRAVRTVPTTGFDLRRVLDEVAAPAGVPS